MDAGDFAHAGDDALQVLEVVNVDDDVDGGLAVGGAGFDVADVGALVGDDGGHLFEHAAAVVAEDGELDRIAVPTIFLLRLGPLDGDAPVGFVHQVDDVGTALGVDGYALAARYVADDVFAADRIATARAINEQVIVAAHGDRRCRAAEDAAEQAAGLVFGQRNGIGRGLLVGGGWRKTGEHLAGGELSVTDGGHQVVGAPEAELVADLLILDFLHVLERHAILARFFFDQLAADFDGALALVDVEPVLDLLARAAGFHQGQPIAAGPVSGLGDDLDDVAATQLVTQGHHAAVYFRTHTGMADLGVD